jgi:acetylornithine deacetylase/succinyl-diaminopimelate desuccinylase-like protein
MSDDDDLARKKRRHRRERIVAAVVIVLAVAATWATRVWDQKSKRELQRDKSYIPKKAVVTPEVLLLQEYVRIDTSTPAGAAAGARWLAALLERNGIRAEIIASAPDRLNVYARIAGRSRGEALLLFNHIDVVPATPAGWTKPPFSGQIDGDSIYGRGTLDMKSLALMQLLTFVEVSRKEQRPAHDLVFLATADEETGSTFGMQWLLAHRPDVFRDVRYGITEGGVTEIVRNRMTYFGIETSGKQIVRLSVAGPDQATMQRFRIALEPFMSQRTPLRILPVVREYFRSAAPSRVAFRPYLEDIDRAVEEGNFWRLPLPYRDLTQNTIWCSAALHRDGRWVLDIHLRNLPDQDPEASLAWMRGLAERNGVAILNVWTKEGPAPVSRTDTPLFRILAAEASRRYRAPVGPQTSYRSSNDSRFLRPHGIECYGLSPHPVDFAQSVSIHGANERLRLDHFAEGMEFMRNVIRDWSESD